MKISLPTDKARRDRIANYIAGKKTVPSVAHLKAKGLVKNNREFYRLFPRGITEACEEAHVPPPAIRLAGMKAALSKRKQVKHEVLTTTSTPAELVNADKTPALKEALECESEVTKLQEEINLSERKESARAKKAELVRQLQAAKDREIAKELPHDSTKYNKAMRRYYQEHPNLQARLLNLFNRLGYATEFDKNLNAIISDQFTTVNQLAMSFPNYFTAMGLQPMEMPTDESFLSDQWQHILEELTDSADTNSYLEFDAKLMAFKPNFLCNVHNTRLTHAGGYRFDCAYGHSIYYHCPKCNSPLNYNRIRFSCTACWHRFMGV